VDTGRRQVAYDARSGTLTVGDRTTVLTCDPGDNEALLRTYLGLVAEQREVILGRGVHLRRSDIAVLAELLDLDDADLEGRLRRILRLSETEAAALHRRLLRQRVVAAAMGVGLLASVPTMGPAGADEAPDGPWGRPVHATLGVSHETMDRHLRIVAPFVADDVEKSAPAPAATPEPDVEPVVEPVVEDEAEVEYSVRYERDPNFVPPEGVDIGDALVIERDPPPAG
jgi:hypothetical protein